MFSALMAGGLGASSPDSMDDEPHHVDAADDPYGFFESWEAKHKPTVS